MLGTAALALRFATRLPTCNTVQPTTAFRLFMTVIAVCLPASAVDVTPGPLLLLRRLAEGWRRPRRRMPLRLDGTNGTRRVDRMRGARGLDRMRRVHGVRALRP